MNTSANPLTVKNNLIARQKKESPKLSPGNKYKTDEKKKKKRKLRKHHAHAHILQTLKKKKRFNAETIFRI
jgi:hypothetical protein